MSDLFENIKEHLNELRNNTQLSDIFISDLERLNEQLNDDIAAHHPYRGVDKAKHIIKINNNPDHEYEHCNGSWYSSPNREKEFESVEDLAEHINTKCDK